MDDFLKFLISPLLSEPDNLVIISTGSTITIQVAQADMGRVIGKHGNVISSIRTLARTYAYFHQLTPINITLAETENH